VAGGAVTAVPSYLIRHAKAGSRRTWRGGDDQRPLSPLGCEQADALVATFAGLPIEAIVSSPSLRCIQTVEPLARARGLGVDVDPKLAEGADPRAALRLAEQLAERPVVLCSHGDVIQGVLQELEDAGLSLGPNHKIQKGSNWVLLRAKDRWTEARYIPPP
jgi:broad specificity phosphatase PhoE